MENTPVTIAVQFRNTITPGSFSSSEFISNGRRYSYTDYNPNANTFQVTQTSGNIVVTNTSRTVYLKDVTVPGIQTYQNAGLIDYTTGTVSLNQINIFDKVNSDGIIFYGKPLSQDVSSSKNDVITIDLSNAIITVKTT